MLISKLPILNNDNARLWLAAIVTLLMFFLSYFNLFQDSFAIHFEQKKNSITTKKSHYAASTLSVKTTTTSKKLPKLLTRKNTDHKIIKTNGYIVSPDEQEFSEDQRTRLMEETKTSIASKRTDFIVGAIHNKNIEKSLLYSKAPVYPAQAREEGMEGTIRLKLDISDAGIVSNVKIIRSTGYPILDSEAVKVTKSWLFKPAKPQSVNRTWVLNMQFLLD